MSRTRDGDMLEESNWMTACTILNAEPFDGDQRSRAMPSNFAARPVVYHWRAGHWACGWVEYLMVRADAPESVQTEAGKILECLDVYPVLDDADFSERETTQVNDYWRGLNVSARVDYLRDCGLSIFSARRDYLPADDNGTLFESLRGY